MYLYTLNDKAVLTVFELITHKSFLILISNLIIKSSELKSTISLLKMEEIILRFPHLSEQISICLDNQSLAKSREISKTWNRLLEEQKFFQIRIIKTIIERLHS